MTELAGKLADAYREALVAAHHETAQPAKEARFAERTEWFETMEVELAELVKRLGIVDPTDPEHSPKVRQFLASMNKPEHQTDFLFLLISIVGLVLTGSQAAAAGVADQLQQKALKSDGYVKPSYGETARLLAQKIISAGEADDWLGSVGIRDAVRTSIKIAGYTHLSPDQAVALWRLGWIGEADVDRIMEFNALLPEEAAFLKSARLNPMDSGIATAAVTQNQIDMPTFETLLAQNGTDPKWAKVIYESAGATMPPEMAVRLFREGRIDVTKYDEILTESNLKNKYVPLMRFLQFRPPPMEQTLRMLRNKIIGPDDAFDLLKKNGYEDIWAQKLVDSAQKSGGSVGKDLSPSTLIDLYEIGKWTRPETEAHLVTAGYDATEASLLMDIADARLAGTTHKANTTRVHSRYVTWKIERGEASTALDALKIDPAIRDALLAQWDVERELSTLHLSRTDIKKAVQLKAITEADGRARLLGMGYDAADVDIVIKVDGWAAAAGAKPKDLTRADYLKQYKQGTITRAQLVSALQTIGYDAAEAEALAKIADGG